MGDDVRQALGDGPNAAQRLRQRARFLAEARGRQSRWAKELAIGALAAALGSAGVFVVWQQQRGPEPLAEPRYENSAFVFNEASQIYLEPGAKAHVVRAQGHEAVIELESGELTCSITSGLKNLWRFKAGENEVIVRGTKFSMLWKPKTESLDVLVREGKVEVHTSDGQIRFVTPAEPLSWTKPAAAPSGAAAQAAAEPAHEPVVELEGLDLTVPEAGPKKKRAAPDGGRRGLETPQWEQVEASAPPPQPERRGLVPEWKRHADAGRYAKAVALVEEQGVDVAMRDVSSDDLLLFADAARLAKRGDLGRAALSTLRERFKGSPDATEAAFRLGRLEFDAQHLPAAGTWFDAYVKEAPQGPFAAEAMGRRLDAWQRAKDARVGQAATDYLERYPKGAYAPLARQVLGEL